MTIDLKLHEQRPTKQHEAELMQIASQPYFSVSDFPYFSVPRWKNTAGLRDYSCDRMMISTGRIKYYIFHPPISCDGLKPDSVSL